MRQGVVYSEPSAMSNENYNPFRESYIDPTAPDPNVDFTGFDVPYDGRTLSDAGSSSPNSAAGWQSVPPRFAEFASAAPKEEFEDFESASDFAETAPLAGLRGSGGHLRNRIRSIPEVSTLDFIPSGAEPVQQRLDVGLHPLFSDPLPLGNGYVAALLDGRFVVVDIRRARERILYEDYLRMLGCGAAVSQQLLFPERLTLSAEEYALLEEHAVEFAALGFDIDCCGGRKYRGEGNSGRPSVGGDRPAGFRPAAGFPHAAPGCRDAARADCGPPGPAVPRTTPRSLSREEAAALLAQLAERGNLGFSPSGKAILVEITPEELRGRLG